MRTHRLLAIGVMVLMLVVFVKNDHASAEVFTGDVPPGFGGSIDFQVTVSQAITLTILGATDADGCDAAGPLGSATTTLSSIPIGAAGTNDVNFGSLDADDCTPGASTGQCCPIAASAEAHAVATLTVDLGTFAGAALDVDICRDNDFGTLDEVTSEVRYALNDTTDWTVANPVAAAAITDLQPGPSCDTGLADKIMDERASAAGALTMQIGLEVGPATSGTGGPWTESVLFWVSQD